MIVSIHQPNFFPWLGYFDKINKSDVFIFLTMSKRSASDNYFTRTSISINDKMKYLSIPFGKQEPIITDLEMPIDKKWISKHLNLIKAAYCESKYFNEIYPDIEKLYMNNQTKYYYEFSISIIRFFLEKLCIDTATYIDVDFNKDFGTSNIRNINICKEVQAKTYLSGVGAKAYNDGDMFKVNGLNLMYQEFTSPYNLSILDVVFNIGFENTKQLFVKSSDCE